MNEIKAAVVQLCPIPGCQAENTDKTAEFIKKAAEEGAELVVFPECSLTGYAPKRAAELAVDAQAPDGNCVQTIERLCDRFGISACFGYMEKQQDKLFIAQELWSEGKRLVYRKTHLGSRESLYFAQGDRFAAASLPKGISCGMQLCWESHIPQISAKYRSLGCQLLLFPYASPMSGEKCLENWSVHLPARASDNGCFAIAANLLFEDGRGGGTSVWDPKGKLIAQHFGPDEALMFCTLSGELPGERYQRIQKGLAKEDMHFISYFDKARSELF